MDNNEKVDGQRRVGREENERERKSGEQDIKATERKTRNKEKIS